MAKAEIVINDMRFVDMNVTISKVFWLRAWCAKVLLLLAARIANCNIEIKTEKN